MWTAGALLYEQHRGLRHTAVCGTTAIIIMPWMFVTSEWKTQRCNGMTTTGSDLQKYHATQENTIIIYYQWRRDREGSCPLKLADSKGLITSVLR